MSVTVAREPLVSSVMTRLLVTVGPDESVYAAWDLLSRGRIHHLPVVVQGRCVAVVEDRAVAAAIAGPIASGRHRVADVMPSRVHCVLPDTPVRRVAEIMALEETTAVPVVDEHMELLGLVTHRDVVRAVATHGLGSAHD
ncbi:MAG TPA: CBS domain-containing protein [Frankiaceae bacterium]|nr:CBS domain-containing protein [Frankiaceae bacterium]